ncbi:MAG: hypothetical protein OXU20_22215 [Myxococcales bacterium]|nr:hypothetical protein [Myxococcales bacterium]
MANKVHVVLMNKGGVGKTFVAIKLAQYLADHHTVPRCVDTDPSTPLFSGFRALGVHYVDVSELNRRGRKQVHEELHDEVMNIIEDTPLERDVVVDTGASNFDHFVNWLLGTEVPEHIESHGRELVIHAVISGGSSQVDCLQCLADMFKNFPTARFVVWLNPFDGDLTVRGRRFDEMQVYHDNRRRISAVIELPEWDRRTARLVERLQSDQLTFAEVLSATPVASSQPAEAESEPDGRLRVRSLDHRRLRIARDEIYAPLAESGCFA